MHNLPSNYSLIYSADEISSRVRTLAEELTEWIVKSEQQSGKQVLAVCVLRGGLFFFSDLLRSLSCSVDIASCRTWNYSIDNNKQEAGVRVSVEEVVAQGRVILLVDDICDSGSTLFKLQNVLYDLGASMVRSVVLVHRQVTNAHYMPTWSAFSYSGDEWFVGYGMDDQNRFRNLPAVYLMKPNS